MPPRPTQARARETQLASLPPTHRFPRRPTPRAPRSTQRRRLLQQAAVLGPARRRPRHAAALQRSSMFCIVHRRHLRRRPGASPPERLPPLRRGLDMRVSLCLASSLLLWLSVAAAFADTTQKLIVTLDAPHESAPEMFCVIGEPAVHRTAVQRPGRHQGRAAIRRRTRHVRRHQAAGPDRSRAAPRRAARAQHAEHAGPPPGPGLPRVHPGGDPRRVHGHLRRAPRLHHLCEEPPDHGQPARRGHVPAVSQGQRPSR